MFFSAISSMSSPGYKPNFIILSICFVIFVISFTMHLFISRFKGILQFHACSSFVSLSIFLFNLFIAKQQMRYCGEWENGISRNLRRLMQRVSRYSGSDVTNWLNVGNRLPCSQHTKTSDHIFTKIFVKYTRNICRQGNART